MKRCHSYDGYSVTESGRVFTHRRRFGLGKGKGGGVVIDDAYQKEIFSSPGHGGYPYFAVITKEGKHRSVPLHTLLMDAFTGPRPEGMEVRHLDGNHLNNNLENLTYGTAKENAEDRVRCGAHTIGETHGRAKLTVDNVRDIRHMYECAIPIAEIAREFNRGESTIRDIVKGKHWKHVK
jgi:hypothetical protein